MSPVIQGYPDPTCSLSNSQFACSSSRTFPVPILLPSSKLNVMVDTLRSLLFTNIFPEITIPPATTEYCDGQKYQIKGKSVQVKALCSNSFPALFQALQ